MENPVSLLADVLIVVYTLWIGFQLLAVSFSVAPFSFEWLEFAFPDALALAVAILSLSGVRRAALIGALLYFTVIVIIWTVINPGAIRTDAFETCVGPAFAFSLLVGIKQVITRPPPPNT